MKTLRLVLIALATLLLAVIAAYYFLPKDGMPAYSTESIMAIPGGATNGKTYEAVVLGPGLKPVARGDQAPRLFRDYPSLRYKLGTSVAAQIAQDEALGNHLILGIGVVGASERETSVEIYADLWAQWWSLVDWQPIEGSGSSYPARIRMKRTGGLFQLIAVDVPEDGEYYGQSLARMLPRWARSCVHRNLHPIENAVWQAALAWAHPSVPAGLFVKQTFAAVPDPHDHKPASSTFPMLAPQYIGCRFVQIPKPDADAYQEVFGHPSADGRYHLHFLLAGDGDAAIEDVRRGTWYLVEAPGRASAKVSGAVSFDPIWQGHTLFIDYDTVIHPYEPTLTHYELNCGNMTVVRAIPMGPLSFNASINQ